MFAPTTRSLASLEKNDIRQRTDHVRTRWTPEQRAWRATLAVRKLAELLPCLAERPN